MSTSKGRRSFIKKIGLGGFAAATSGMAAASGFKDNAGVGEPGQYFLKKPGYPRAFNGEYKGEYLNKVAFPMGGIGAGMVCLEGTGCLSHVSIKNKPDVFNEPYVFAALHIKGDEGATRVLEGQVPAWKMFGPRRTANGSGDKTYGLPRFKDCSFLARFPFGSIQLKDKHVPLDVSITGWSPFIPTDHDNSSLPVAVLEYTFINTASKTIEAVFSFNSKNFYSGNGKINSIKNGFQLTTTANSPAGFAAWLNDDDAVVDHCWFRGGWFDAQSILWRNIETGNVVNNAPTDDAAPGASIHLPFSVGSGKTKKVVVNLCWYHAASGVSFGMPPKDVGQAFNKPSEGTVMHQNPVSGFAGKGLLNSFDPGGDAQMGILQSPEIKLDKNYLKFLVGGGGDIQNTSVNLLVDNKIVRSATGNYTETLSKALWDLREFRGKTGVIKIVDNATEGWGHVLADQFVLTDNKNEDLKNLSANAKLIEDFEGNSFGKWKAQKVEAPKTDCCSSANCDCTYKPWYAGWFKSIHELINYWNDNYSRLKKNSELFRDAFYASTLPAEVLEAIAANLTILKSPTVLRQTDGKLWSFEGCNDDSGCCHGNCTHVWNYAQAVPHLFPALERTLRETEFEVSQNDAGHQNFRSNLPISPTSHGFHAAADGQLGGILKIYRDWRIVGDTDWLKSLYPKVKDSLDYCIRVWDPMHKGILEEPHHNTYDIEFWGPDGMCTSFYLGALYAMIQMSKVLGKPYSNYEELLDKGKKYLENELYNGEYFFQKIKWEGLQSKNPVDVQSFGGAYSKEATEILKKEGPKYQYGTGCLSDGILGMWLASMCGLDEVVDKKKTISHLLAVHKYNLKEDLSAHPNPQRPTYALGNEGGLLLCTWPKGGKLSLPFVYSNEVWTGIEYQVASHLMLHGKVKEGLDIVRECRKRYDGFTRNPFNEYECGHWYARAMSSYGMLQSLTGLRYDAVEKVLHVDSKVGDFTCFLSTQSGFGTVVYKKGKASVKEYFGKIEIDSIVYS